MPEVVKCPKSWDFGYENSIMGNFYFKEVFKDVFTNQQPFISI